MQECHGLAQNASRSFATAPYCPQGSEPASLEPVLLPSRCIYADGEADSGGDACRIGVHHLRDRKTGPAFPITVLHCYTHGRAFTLYPLGHFPYGRVALAPVGVDGEPSWTAEGEQADHRALVWSSTLFAGAVAASKTGTKPQPTAPNAWWATEPPDVLKAPAALLGLEPAPDERGAELVARQLGLPLPRLKEASGAYRQARGVVARAQVLTSVLDELAGPGRCLLDRLLGAGAGVGCWGQVERWDAGAAGPCRRLFPGRGMPAG